MTRTHFEEDKKKLYDDMFLMGSLVGENLLKAAESLKKGDVELAEEARKSDASVDAMLQKIEDQCGVIIATQQPVAKDMREMIAALKIGSELERCGDHASHLAKAVIKISGEASLKPFETIGRMASLAAVMLRGAMDAYMAGSGAKAREVAELDNEIDTLHKALVHELLDFMREHPDKIPQATRAMTTSGFMERLGDHITNMCEAIVFIDEGAHVELN